MIVSGIISGPSSLKVLYFTDAAIFYRNRPAVYTIAIYSRLYTAEWRQR